MSKNTTVNEAVKEFLSNIIFNAENIRHQVENRVYSGNNTTRDEAPKAA